MLNEAIIGSRCFDIVVTEVKHLCKTFTVESLSNDLDLPLDKVSATIDLLVRSGSVSAIDLCTFERVRA